MYHVLMYIIIWYYEVRMVTEFINTKYYEEPRICARAWRFRRAAGRQLFRSRSRPRDGQHVRTAVISDYCSAHNNFHSTTAQVLILLRPWLFLGFYCSWWGVRDINPWSFRRCDVTVALHGRQMSGSVVRIVSRHAGGDDDDDGRRPTNILILRAQWPMIA